MKSKIFLLSCLGICFSLFAFAQSATDTIKVWGNCDMCKEKIEKAAKEAGAATADWSSETLELIVSYDAAKSSNKKIQMKIASVGYDTQDVKASDASYKKLDKCCQYKRTKDNAATGTKCGADCCKKAGDANSSCCKTDMSCCKDHNSATCCTNGVCSKSK